MALKNKQTNKQTNEQLKQKQKHERNKLGEKIKIHKVFWLIWVKSQM